MIEVPGLRDLIAESQSDVDVAGLVCCRDLQRAALDRPFRSIRGADVLSYPRT